MQAAFPHSPPAQNQHGTLLEASSFTPAHRASLNPYPLDPNRSSHGLKIPHLLHNASAREVNAPPETAYSSSYERNNTGSAEQISPINTPRHPNDSAPDNPINNMNHMISAGQQPQKRAYRQRRKDPSCDACRERKVKCDASDSSSCTECSNRNVRCLFTKETNRRMSSIKQVQDLERQLAQARQQLNQLRSGIPKIDSLMDTDYSVGEDVPKIPEIGCRPNRPVPMNLNHNLSHVRSKMQAYGQGLISFPPSSPHMHSQQAFTTDTPVLPPPSIADALLRPYFSCVHSIFPLVHWPTFSNDYDRIRRTGSFNGVSRGWVAVFFSMLACGSLHSVDSSLIAKGKEYLQISVNLIDLWQDSFTVDQVQTSLLISLFLYEFNLKSASWVWLGSAVRIAQDLGLHAQYGPWSPLDGETRKRIWWSLYAWERLVVLELGRPLYINDEDCDVDLPSPTDEQLIPEGVSNQSEQKTTPLLAVIHITRAISQLNKTLRASVISSDTLETFERHFRMCLATFPPDYRMKSDQYLDPCSLAPIIYLQNTRLLLHRHNLSPSCSPEMRHMAIDQCLAVAHDTTRILLRCMRSPNNVGGVVTAPQGSDWRYPLAAAATTILCSHIWRCILFLLFRAEYTAALVCIQACSAIGDARAVNVCSGRYITFFLRCLLERRTRSDASLLERDEDLMAYVSGDAQNRINGGWVWRNNDTHSPLDETSPRSATSPTNPQGPAYHSQEQEPDWEGWGWIEQTVKYLSDEQQRNLSPTDKTGAKNPTPADERMLLSSSRPAESVTALLGLSSDTISYRRLYTRGLQSELSLIPHQYDQMFLFVGGYGSQWLFDSQPPVKIAGSIYHKSVGGFDAIKLHTNLQGPGPATEPIQAAKNDLMNLNRCAGILHVVHRYQGSGATWQVD